MGSRVEFSSGDIVRELAIAGIGIALLPEERMVAEAINDAP